MGLIIFVLYFQDVLEINKIRYLMNSILGPRSFGCVPPAPSMEVVREISGKCLQGLFRLMRPRCDLEAVASRHTHKWNKIELGHLVRSETPEDHILNLLPLHDYINIVPKTSEVPKWIRLLVGQLISSQTQNKIHFSLVFNTCCVQYLYSIHILLLLHRIKINRIEIEFGYWLPNGR